MKTPEPGDRITIGLKPSGKKNSATITPTEEGTGIYRQVKIELNQDTDPAVIERYLSDFDGGKLLERFERDALATLEGEKDLNHPIRRDAELLLLNVRGCVDAIQAENLNQVIRFAIHAGTCWERMRTRILEHITARGKKDLTSRSNGGKKSRKVDPEETKKVFTEVAEEKAGDEMKVILKEVAKRTSQSIRNVQRHLQTKT